jgi:hypothetical protein
MTRRTLAAFALALLAAAGPACAQDKEEWISLFDGKTLDGWKVNNISGKSKWEVIDGAMCGSGESSMIVTEKGGFKNFKVRAEVKINDKGNSGLYFRSTANPGFADGYECQINATHADPIRTGSIYQWVHVFDAANKPDEWYTQEIEVRDLDWRGQVVTSILVRVDGKILFQFLDHTREFKTGHFAFQQHDPGSKVCIRKVEVMPLPDTTPGK